MSKLIKTENQIICDYLKMQYVNAFFEEDMEEEE